jgi:hypothetical protein
VGKQRTRLPALTTLEAVKEALDVRLGRRGDKLDSAVTFRDLEESGAFNLVPRGGSGIGIARPSPNAGGPIMPDWFGVDVDLTTWVPPAPTGFLATAMFDGIFIEWDWPPKFGVVGHTEVYRSTTNDASARKFLTAVDGLTYMDPISGEDEQEYFYWIRFRSMGDKVGPYTGPVSAVSIPLSATLIERLEGEINESLLAQHLRERIDLIDGEGGLVSQVQEQGDTFARDITQVQTEVDNNFGALQQRITSSFNEVSGKVESIYSLRINSNGRISGFGLSDDGFESVFGVEADRFYVSGSGSNDRPFMVSGGRVYIKDAAIANAAIDSAKIKNGAVNNAKIAFAAIDEAKISDAAISSAKIKNGAISSAKIGQAAIKTANIGHAEVDTLNIKGDAVIVPAIDKPGSVLYGKSYSRDIINKSIYLDEPGMLMAIFSCRQGYNDGQQNVSFELVIDGRTQYSGSSGAYADYVNISEAVFVGSGWRNVKVYWRAHSSVSIGNRTCVLMGVKR